MDGLNGLELAELRHRLLGNFQLLQALVSIRLRSVEDPESRRHLTWLSDVVAALALINRRLTASGAADFGAYMIESVSFWRRICAGREISFSLEAAAVELPETTASALALILHELVANAVEHAFADGRGRVNIALGHDNGLLELSVSDNGVGGQPDAKDGLVLVSGLAEHLKGSVHVTGSGGLNVVVRIPHAGRPPARRKPH